MSTVIGSSRPGLGMHQIPRNTLRSIARHVIATPPGAGTISPTKWVFTNRAAPLNILNPGAGWHEIDYSAWLGEARTRGQLGQILFINNAVATGTINGPIWNVDSLPADADLTMPAAELTLLRVPIIRPDEVIRTKESLRVVWSESDDAGKFRLSFNDAGGLFPNVSLAIWVFCWLPEEEVT